jgi:hypothetical protein
MLKIAHERMLKIAHERQPEEHGLRALPGWIVKGPQTSSTVLTSGS